MKKIGMFLAMASAIALTACSGEAKDEGAPAAETAEVPADKSPAEGGTAGEIPETAEEGAAKDAAMAETDDPIANKQPPAKAKEGETVQARCVITAKAGNGSYDDSCQFESFGGASFMVTPSEGDDFFDGIKEFVLEADTADAAGMSLRDANGDLNYVGPATRKGACWSNDKFEVCAYGLTM